MGTVTPGVEGGFVLFFSHSPKSALPGVCRDGILLGMHSRAFASCEAQLLLPCCHHTIWLPAGETNTGLENTETGALWPFKSCACNESHRIAGTLLHRMLKQIGRVINSNPFVPFIE